LAAIQTLHGGPTIFSAVCVRKSKSRISRSNRWVTSLRYLKGFKPRLRHRRPLSLSWLSSEPGPRGRQTKLAAGGTMADVVKITIFVTDITQREEVWRAQREVFTGDFPASSLVQVAALAEPSVKVEIEAVAHIGAGKR
jgi:hypothetical protein